MQICLFENDILYIIQVQSFTYFSSNLMLPRIPVFTQLVLRLKVYVVKKKAYFKKQKGIFHKGLVLLSITNVFLPSVY